MAEKHVYNHVTWYLNDVTSKIVAKSGIPTDRFHIGKIVLQSFKEDPDFVAQVRGTQGKLTTPKIKTRDETLVLDSFDLSAIDGGTGESETNESLLRRSIQCAISFRQMGLKHGDTIIIMGPNHLDLAVPFYAAMYLGIVVAPVDRTLKVAELCNTFVNYNPSVIFCQTEKTPEVQEALKNSNLETKIFTFDQISHEACLSDLLKADAKEIENFEVEDFNAEESIAMILPTSGSTGLSKGAALTYKTWTFTGPHIWATFTKFPTPSQSWLILSPIQWVTAVIHYMVAPYLKYTRIQTSKPVTEEHTKYLMKTYQPSCTAISAGLVRYLLNASEKGECDLSCLEQVFIAGAVVDKDTIELLKVASPKATVVNAFGMTETSTIVFQGVCPLGSCGKPGGLFQCRLINIDKQIDIEEPHVSGELWLKGPMFKEYVNNPKATAEAFAEDGWFKTGDLFYRDQEWNYFFVERIKMMLKYKSYQISPTEVEVVIREHPAVLDAAVTGIPDPESGDLPVAFVILKPGSTTTAQEIKDLVKEKLSDAKQLRGGVAFISDFPLTSTAKINRVKLREMAQEVELE